MDSRLSALIVSVSAVALMAAGAVAQSGTDIDFGETAEAYAGDGLCADPRFEGEGMAGDLAKAGRLADADDCRALYESGDIQLEGTVASDEAAEDPAVESEADDAGEAEAADESVSEEAAPVGEADAADETAPVEDAAGDETEAADETAETAEAVEADDAGVTGEAAEAVEADAEETAEEVEAPVADGAAEAAEEEVEAEDAATGDAETDAGLTTPEAVEAEATEDMGEVEAEAGDEASDAAEADQSETAGEENAAEEAGAGTVDTGTDADAIDFGDDESEFALDGECDDARFAGEGMTNTDLIAKDIGHDATDCRTGFESGALRLRGADDVDIDEAIIDPEEVAAIETEPGLATGIMFNGIDFGDDASKWANDGECDDPRFEGEGMTSTRLLPEDAGHDATDCLGAWKTGKLMLARD